MIVETLEDITIIYPLLPDGYASTDQLFRDKNFDHEKITNSMLHCQIKVTDQTMLIGRYIAMETGTYLNASELEQFMAGLKVAVDLFNQLEDKRNG